MKTSEIIRENKHHPIISLIDDIRNTYEKNRFVFIPGNTVKEILMLFWATEADLNELKCSWDYLSEDPTMPFRKSRNGRFLLDYSNEIVSRLEFKSFVLSEEEWFKRSDAGITRNFRWIQDNLQSNPAFQGLLKLQSYIINNLEIVPRDNLVDNKSQLHSTVFQLRTITTKEKLWEPAKEWVHSDGVEHVMTTFLNADNITDKSAITNIHNLEQKIGVPWDQVDPKFIIGTFQHKHFLDTILVVDSETTHSVSPVFALDPEKNALRDIILLCTRRLKSPNHSTYEYESTLPHPDMPLSFEM